MRSLARAMNKSCARVSTPDLAVDVHCRSFSLAGGVPIPSGLARPKVLLDPWLARNLPISSIDIKCGSLWIQICGSKMTQHKQSSGRRKPSSASLCAFGAVLPSRCPGGTRGLSFLTAIGAFIFRFLLFFSRFRRLTRLLPYLDAKTLLSFLLSS